jgi:hypothetical protein
VAAGQLGELVHLPLRMPGTARRRVDGLAALEVDVRVLRGAAQHRVVRVHGALRWASTDPRRSSRGRLAHGGDLVHLVRGAEAVEEMQEGHPAASVAAWAISAKSMTPAQLAEHSMA